MENLTTFVSSRGILKSCDSHNKKPTSSSPHIDPNLIDHHRPGGSIYVCTDALVNFAENFLPRIVCDFVLVSGDSDVPIAEALLNHPAIKTLVESNYLISWYAQNLATKHPKLHHLPIGLDYHTMWERPGIWGMSAISPIAQENLLLNSYAASPEFNQRYLAGYCNWHFAIHRGDRQECQERIDKAVAFFEPTAVPRSSSWLRQAECMFVISPEGAGLDCHRTWESLLLGNVPIVKRNSIADLYNNLPVLIVEDWQKVNRETMLAFIQVTATHKFDFSYLFREYWISKIRQAESNLIDPMTLTEFRKFITRKTG